MKKKILSLFCLLCMVWSMGGCKYLAGAKVCVEHPLLGKVCYLIDKDGDGKVETHATEDDGDTE